MDEANRPIRVAIVDDHEIVRRGLRLTIAEESDMQLVGEAGNGQSALDLVARDQPDVLLMDIEMPDMGGITAAAKIHAVYPAVAVLILTNYGQDDKISAALKSNVMGYLLKDISGDLLVQAIRGAARGEPQLHPAVARRLMRQGLAVSNPLHSLTEREREVLHCVALGLSNKEVGGALHLSETTVKGYVSTILSKLQVLDRTQAALLAVRYGLVRPDELPDGPR